MDFKEIDTWQQHNFNEEKKGAERKTLIVVLLTLFTMIVEIGAGWIFGSTALFADGWHMGTHVLALSISLLAYFLARRYSEDKAFAFGPWKIEVLGAYTSAIFLGLVGFFVIYISVERFLKPVNIEYNDALLVAIIGLLVNVLSALILSSTDEDIVSGSCPHEHKKDGRSNKSQPHVLSAAGKRNMERNIERDLKRDMENPSKGNRKNKAKPQHEEDRTGENHSEHIHSEQKDLNLHAAYLHVLADALTSVLAILALLGAKYLGWWWLDPAAGIVGAFMIFRWTVMLLKETSRILLDKEMDSPLASRIRDIVESEGSTIVSDLHLWRVARDKYACIITVASSNPCSVMEYKDRLRCLKGLAHVTIEINQCNIPERKKM